MRHHWIVVIIASSLLSGCYDIRDISRSVGRVFCLSSGQIVSSGSGFIVNKEGFFVTNKHVIEQCDDLKIAFSSGEMAGARIESVSELDLAIIKLVDYNFLLPPPLGLTPQVEQGDRVIAIGYPGTSDNLVNTEENKFERTITEGITSKITVDSNKRKVIQTDVAINPGNSGGPLLDACGEVVGINTFGPGLGMIQSLGAIPQGTNFAVHASEIIEQLGTTVKYSRGYFRCSNLKYQFYNNPLILSMFILLLMPILFVILTLYNQSRRKGFVQAVTQMGRTLLKQQQKTEVDDHSKAKTDQKVYMTCLSGPHQGEKFTLNKGDLILGRDPKAASIIFPATCLEISRRHAKLTYFPEKREFILQDLDSTKGTFLSSGRKLSPHEKVALRTGDKFYLVSTNYLFQVIEN